MSAGKRERVLRKMLVSVVFPEINFSVSVIGAQYIKVGIIIHIYNKYTGGFCKISNRMFGKIQVAIILKPMYTIATPGGA